MNLQNRRRSASNVTTYKHSILKAEIANPCQWIQLLDQSLAGNRYLLSIYFLFLQEAGVQSSSGQSFATTPGENEEVELMKCEATMIEDVKPLNEDTEETLLSQAFQISVPEEEVSIWCDEKEIQNKRRQALNDAMGDLTSGRFSPILST